MSRKLVRRLVVTAILLVAGAFALRFALTPDPVEVRTAVVERGAVERTATNTRAGTVAARRRARVSPEVGGPVAELPRREGDRVEAGEVLLVLGSELERGQLDVASRDKAAAGAERVRSCLGAEQAERERQRQDKLFDEGLVPVDVVDRARTAAEQAAAACAAATAVLNRAIAACELAETSVAKRTLRAPFAGVVAEVSTEVGEWITPAPPGVPIPPVIDLIDPGSIYLSLPMDEVDAGALVPGLPVRASIDSHPGRAFPGRVTRVAPYVLDLEAQNRTVEIEVELDDPAFAATLLPGTSADVEVILDATPDALRVPTAAVLAGDRALVLEGELLAERAIERGLGNWEWTEVRSGLAAGERVVVSFESTEVRAGARAIEAPADAAP
jgi:HlyD family secretion protein